MKFRNQREESPDLNLTPLIDVVFLLLIFFMVSTTFNKESEIQIDLPEASGDQPVKQEFIVEISIDSLGRFFVNDRRLVDNKLNTLKLAISQTIGTRKKQPHVIINSDKDTPYQHVVTAMDAVRQLGLNKFSLTTKQANKEN